MLTYVMTKELQKKKKNGFDVTESQRRQKMLGCIVISLWLALSGRRGNVLLLGNRDACC